ncbi:MAG: hypothetical protein ACK46D_08315 [Roseiflexaceae bacterium]|jgi:hypothetical protein
MTADEFRQHAAPQPTWCAALTALWHDARGDWHAAHDALQDDHSNDGAWVHAYLHRVEGDEFNAAYWYRRARRPVCRTTLAEEWMQLVQVLAENA